MKIEYIISDKEGNVLLHKYFDETDRDSRVEFAKSARQAWNDGHSVSSRRAEVNEQ